MRSPIPGMDPYLEHPSLWPDGHNSLITAFRDHPVSQVAPRCYVTLERRAYLLSPDKFDLRLDDTQPPVPLLGQDDADWARMLLSSAAGAL